MRSAQATNSHSGFTLAEVLAALLFMAIVVPVAMEGLHIASLAGAVAQRKAEAARIAQKVINESLITTNWSQSLQSGIIAEGQRQFRWSLRSDPWNQDPSHNMLRQLSVEVFFTAQARDYSVKMSTLVDTSQLLGAGNSSF
jgi:type II secretory pathway pseudopilin PulG